MRPHVMQVKPPAVSLPSALRRDRFFFSSATRSDSKCCTEALHIARHDDLPSAYVTINPPPGQARPGHPFVCAVNTGENWKPIKHTAIAPVYPFSQYQLVSGKSASYIRASCADRKPYTAYIQNQPCGSNKQ